MLLIPRERINRLERSSIRYENFSAKPSSCLQYTGIKMRPIMTHLSRIRSSWSTYTVLLLFSTCSIMAAEPFGGGQGLSLLANIRRKLEVGMYEMRDVAFLGVCIPICFPFYLTRDPLPSFSLSLYSSHTQGRTASWQEVAL